LLKNSEYGIHLPNFSLHYQRIIVIFLLLRDECQSILANCETGVIETSLIH
jgi:hypothetical protein